MTDREFSIPSDVELETGDSLHRISGADAHTILTLVEQASTDPVLQKEFQGTLRAYTNPVEVVRDRLTSMYDTEPHQRVGYIVLDPDREAIGMTYIGVRHETRVFTPDTTITEFKGINFSSWLLQHARNRGVRTAIGDRTCDIGRHLSMSEDSLVTDWTGGTIYTGIREGNNASERVVKKLGYVPAGVLLHDSAYRAWLKPEEWTTLPNLPK